jgi:hypothetical protein
VVLLENTLTTSPAQRAPRISHAAAIPFLFMGLMAALVWLKDKPIIQTVITKYRYLVYLLVIVVVLGAILYISRTGLQNAKLPGQAEAVTNQVLALIPDGASVTVTNNIFPHVCDRTEAYLPWFHDKYTPIENGDWGISYQRH